MMTGEGCVPVAVGGVTGGGEGAFAAEGVVVGGGVVVDAAPGAPAAAAGVAGTGSAGVGVLTAAAGAAGAVGAAEAAEAAGASGAVGAAGAAGAVATGAGAAEVVPPTVAGAPESVRDAVISQAIPARTPTTSKPAIQTVCAFCVVLPP